MGPAHRMERDLRPTLTRPPDFEGFWAKTCEELSAVEPDARYGRVPPVARTFPADISFARKRRGHRLQHRVRPSRLKDLDVVFTQGDQERNEFAAESLLIQRV